MTNFPCHPQIFERFTAMLAHPTIVFSSLHFTTKFKCAKTWLICSNTDFKIAHAKIGGGVLRAKMIFSHVQFFRNLKVFNYLLQNRTHENGWLCSCLTHTNFRVCDFRYSLCFQVSFQFRVREFLCPISLFTFCITYLLFVRIWGFNSY